MCFCKCVCVCAHCGGRLGCRVSHAAPFSSSLMLFQLVLIWFTGDTVKIGDVSYQLKAPRNPELVPVNHSMCHFKYNLSLGKPSFCISDTEITCLNSLAVCHGLKCEQQTVIFKNDWTWFRQIVVVGGHVFILSVDYSITIQKICVIYKNVHSNCIHRKMKIYINNNVA